MSSKILDKTFEERSKLFREELEKLIKKYGVNIALIPAVKPVPFGDGIIYTLDAQLQLFDAAVAEPE